MRAETDRSGQVSRGRHSRRVKLIQRPDFRAALPRGNLPGKTILKGLHRLSLSSRLD